MDGRDRARFAFGGLACVSRIETSSSSSPRSVSHTRRRREGRQGLVLMSPRNRSSFARAHCKMAYGFKFNIMRTRGLLIEADLLILELAMSRLSRGRIRVIRWEEWPE